MVTHTYLNCVTFHEQHNNIQMLRLACFEFQLRLDSNAELPVYKGSLFHGALGQALEKIGSRFRDYFYNPSLPPHWNDAQQAPPRPYILIPPWDDKVHYKAGETLNLGIVLYGAAVDYFMVIFAAIEHLGEFMGLGRQRARFVIDNIKQLSLHDKKTVFMKGQLPQQAETMHAGQFIVEAPDAVPRIRLHHTTRLRLKAGNRLLYTAPPFNLFMTRLLGRTNALATLYGGGIVITPEQKQYLLDLAETVQIEHTTLQWHDWKRHSQRSGSAMPFGGLLGETVYRGELAPFMPWLSLGQWIGVGGKTSFGLGLYRLEIIKQDD